MSAIVILTGKVGRDLELQHLESDGRSVATVAFPVVSFESVFNKATKSYQTKAVYHRCVAYGKVAENLARLFNKGKGIQVTGSLQYREFESNGQKRKITEIYVDRFFFTDAPDNSPSPASVPPVQPQPTEPQQTASAPTPPTPSAVPLGYSLSASYAATKPAAAPKPQAEKPATAVSTPVAAVAGGGAPLPAMPLDSSELAEMDLPF